MLGAAYLDKSSEDIWVVDIWFLTTRGTWRKAIKVLKAPAVASASIYC